MKRALICLVLAWLLWRCEPPLIRAGEPPAEPPGPAEHLSEVPWPGQPTSTIRLDANCSNLGERDPFTFGQCTFQLMAGHYKKSSAGPGGPAFDYAPIAFRVGCMMADPVLDGCFLRGNGEILLEAHYSPVLRDFGTYVAGPDLILRYNFVQTSCILVPYLQGGAGFVWTDAYKWPSPYQRLIGQEFEFLLRAEVGARLMMTECVSFDAEVGFQHISNASLALRNAGVNNLGFTLGLTYFFGKVK